MVANINNFGVVNFYENNASKQEPKQKVLAKQIEKKVYLYGFLKGEVEVNKDELLAECQARVKNLEHQLHEQ